MKLKEENRRQHTEMRNELNKIYRIIESNMKHKNQDIEQSSRGTSSKYNQEQKNKYQKGTTTAYEESSSDNDINSKSETDGKWQEIRKRKKANKTYAQATKKQTPERKQNNNTGTWVTPERSPEYEVRIQAQGGNDTKGIINRIKEMAKDELKSTGGLKNITRTQNGQLVLKFKDRRQQKLITDKIRYDNSIKIEERKIRKPKLQITGVQKGTADNDLKEIIKEENEDIGQILGNNWVEELNIVARKTCRDKNKENIVIDTELKIFKHLMRKGRISLDLMMLHVEEYTEIPVCFRCSKHGHVTKHCSQEGETCYKCGQAHAGRDCHSKNLDCPNCKTANIDKQNRRHDARDKKCPIYKRKKDIYRKSISYQLNE